MSVGLYLFLTFLVIMVIVINSEDEGKTKVKKDVSKIKKPDLDKMYQNSARELRDMFRESKEKINQEYERNFKAREDFNECRRSFDK
jgi:hypothetical protein